MIKPKYFSLIGLTVLIAAASGLFWLSGYLHRPLQVSGQEVVQVPTGSSLASVLSGLSQRGMLGEGTDARLSRLSARLYNLLTDVSRRIHVGEYAVEPEDSLLTLMAKLERGDVLQRPFTLVEGWDIRQLRQALAKAPGLVHTLTGIADEQLMAHLGQPPGHPEGWFAPDTYFYVAGDRDVDILRRALARQQALLESLWQNRATGLPYADPYEALIMASIVEKETGVPEERSAIAGVFVARLERGMRLQTDPTVIYGLGEAYDGNIRRRDLKQATPYNTYVIRGLPPTPIAMPGEEAVRAALNPAQTDALYFVARGDGSHWFSRTLEEHQQAVRRYQQQQRRQDYRSAPALGQP